MARGWESKSVESQIDMAENRSAVARAKVLSDVSLDLLRKKESILMSRTRVVRDLENAQNPRYRTVLSKALKDLDAQLSTLAAD
jgi:DNA-binding phage protein